MTLPSPDTKGPLVSVIMNAYNSDRYLAETLASLFAQTYQNWELIFWDNGSTDNCKALFDSVADERCRYFYHAEKVSLSSARNYAVDQANGDWVAFLDCDDIWLPEKLERQVALTDQATTKPAIVYCRTESFSADGVQGETLPYFVGKPLPQGAGVLIELLRHGNIISMSSAMVDRNAYQTAGGIPEAYRFAEDYYLFAKIAEEHLVACDQHVQCRYRVHNHSATYNQKRLGLIESIAILKRWRHVLPAGEFNNRRRVYHTLIAIDELRSGKYPLQTLKRLLKYAQWRFLVMGSLRHVFRRFVLRQRLVS